MSISAQKCRFQSHHRGMKELNYLLELFTEKEGTAIWDNPLYQELMTLDDILLWEAMMAPHEASLPSHLVPLVERIRSVHSSAHD